MEILSREDKETITKALEDCKWLKEEIAKAKRAGLDVATLEAELREAEEKLKALKRVYIEGR